MGYREVVKTGREAVYESALDEGIVYRVFMPSGLVFVAFCFPAVTCV